MVSTEICNLALSHLGVSTSIADMDERSLEAQTCSLFYDMSRKYCLKEFWWPFAMSTVELALVEENPNDEWAFSYQYPANCLRIRRILSGKRVDTLQSRVKFQIGRGDSGRLIYTDKEDAEVEFVYDEDSTDRFPDEFILAQSYRLASLIAPRLTSGDQYKLGEKCLKMYFYEASKAAMLAGSEEVQDENPDSEFIRIREE